MRYRAVMQIFHGRPGTLRKLYQPGDFYEPTEAEEKCSAKVKIAFRDNKMNELPDDIKIGAIPMHFVPEKEWTPEAVDMAEFDARLRQVRIKPMKSKDLSEADMRLVNVMREAMGGPAAEPATT